MILQQRVGEAYITFLNELSKNCSKVEDKVLMWSEKTSALKGTHLIHQAQAAGTDFNFRGTMQYYLDSQHL